MKSEVTFEDVHPEFENPLEKQKIDRWYANYVNNVNEKKEIKKRENVIYFIRAGEHGIKIGYTYELEKRLKCIQQHCPIKLEVICTMKGSALIEKELHRKFSHLKIHGEWFKPHMEIFDYISTIS